MTGYFAKNPTALGLSVSAMVWRDSEFLLMRRSDNGHWGLPGGFVEIGESVSDAARREVLEETGWSIELGDLIGVYSDPETQVVDYRQAQLSSEHGSAGVEMDDDTPQCPAEAVADLRGNRGCVQVVNLCFRAVAREQGEPTTPEETLEMGFFAADSLPAPFVPIHMVRVEDGLERRREAFVR